MPQPTRHVVALPKGGTGKSSLAAELARALAAAGYRVLAIDLDQQGNFTQRLGIGPASEISGTTADVLTGDLTVAEAATPTALENVWVLAGTTELTNVEEAPPADLVTSLRDMDLSAWDAVVIDCPPAVGWMLRTGLAAADKLIAPVETAAEAYEQFDRLAKVVAGRVSQRINPGLAVNWVVPTLYDGRRLLDKEIDELLRSEHPGKVTAPVRYSVKVRESYVARVPVSVYAPDEPVSADLRAAVGQIIETNGERTTS